MLYRTGERTVPWATPASRVTGFDSVFSTPTTHVRFSRKDCKGCISFLGQWSWDSLQIRPLCHTWSNALLTCRKTAVFIWNYVMLACEIVDSG